MSATRRRRRRLARREIGLPNALTFARLLLAPVCAVLVVRSGPGWSPLAGLVFGAAALTDAFDGHLARKRGQITRLGQLLDPVADKLLICGCLIACASVGRAPMWVAAVILVREIAVTGCRLRWASRQRIVPAASRGKIKMRWQVAAVALAATVPTAVAAAVTVVLAVTAAITWWSAIEVLGRRSTLASPGA